MNHQSQQTFFFSHLVRFTAFFGQLGPLQVIQLRMEFMGINWQHEVLQKEMRSHLFTLNVVINKVI